MSAILSSAICLSIDSLVAAFGLAPFLRSRAERYRLAACSACVTCWVRQPEPWNLFAQQFRH
jgi:hypothetical protein